MISWSDVPTLTPGRVRAAYAVAVVTDVLQILLGPFGWEFADEILDVAAALDRMRGRRDRIASSSAEPNGAAALERTNHRRVRLSDSRAG